ncbi:UNVERIFIED_CONTAM: hypothetical protein Sradi_4552300 [Sesamum radiatum]|uniref:Uncharacterized protein n=1 Tax=Sesamum radiatum TaxID=300843 RepID=A0AAW2NA00_SESRA
MRKSFKRWPTKFGRSFLGPRKERTSWKPDGPAVFLRTRSRKIIRGRWFVHTFALLLKLAASNFNAQGYPPVGEDTSFLNFELVLDTAPDSFARPTLIAETAPIKSGMALFD